MEPSVLECLDRVFMFGVRFPTTEQGIIVPRRRAVSASEKRKFLSLRRLYFSDKVPGIQ